MKTIEMEIQCKSCDGTGVYVGMCERGGAAVVCKTCKGTGKQHFKFEYEEFTGLKSRDDVIRVYADSYGYYIAPKDVSFGAAIGKIDLRKEGVSYADFKNGVMPEHIKTLVCPMLADQGACHDIKGFVNMCEKLHGGCLWGVSLAKCKNQPNKADCWERFNQGQKSSK